MTSTSAINQSALRSFGNAAPVNPHSAAPGNKTFSRSVRNGDTQVEADKSPVAARDGWPQQPYQSQGWQQSSMHGNAYQPSAYNGLSPVMSQLWNQQPQLRGKVEAAGAVIDFLYQNGINARLGGSLAASAYGAMREPKDLDIYVNNPAELDYGYQMLSRLDTIATTPDGQRVRLQGFPGRYYKPNAVGQLNFAMTYQNGQQQSVTADLVNPNVVGVGSGLLTPAQRGIPELPGNATEPHLIAGFLRRHITQPELSASKQDVYQIAAILRHAGVNPNSQLVYFDLVNAIGQQFTPEMRQLAEYKMREILNWMTTGQI